MATRTQPAITRDPELHSGAAGFTGTRVAVRVLFDDLADGQRLGTRVRRAVHPSDALAQSTLRPVGAAA